MIVWLDYVLFLTHEFGREIQPWQLMTGYRIKAESLNLSFNTLIHSRKCEDENLGYGNTKVLLQLRSNQVACFVGGASWGAVRNRRSFPGCRWVRGGGEGDFCTTWASRSLILAVTRNFSVRWRGKRTPVSSYLVKPPIVRTAPPSCWLVLLFTVCL